MSSAGTYYTYVTDAEGNPILDTNGNKQIETTWTITEETGLFGAKTGNSTVTVQDSSGQTIQTLTGVPDGLLAAHIQTGANATNGSLLSVLGGQWVSVPGSSGTINIVLSALSAPTFTIGGTTDINFVVNAATAITIDIYGGTASFSGGLVAGALSGSTINIGYGGTYNGNTQLISLLQGTTVNFTSGGGTLVLNGGGVFLNLSGTSITGYDPKYNTIEIENTVAPVSGYVISGSGTSRTITLQGSDGQDIASYSVTLADGANVPTGTFDNAANSQNLATNPLRITYSNGNTYIGACFLAGSMIKTPDGDVAVEEILAGDKVIAFDWKEGKNVVRPVVWAGKTQASIRYGLPDDEAGYPVRILQNAISDGVPYKDMLITPEHCLFFNGKFVPARMLVNGETIFYDKSITSYEYYHLETDQHSVIISDGVLTESYLDTGNRHTFRQEGNVVNFGGPVKSWEGDAAAPLDVDRSFVEPLFHQLQERANKTAQLSKSAKQSNLTSNSDLHLVTNNGTVIRKAREANGRMVFMIPASAKTVRLVSRASRPCDTIGPFVDDRRQLGVLVGQITLFENSHSKNLTDHYTSGILDGWNNLEQENLRWTTGNGFLDLGKRSPDSIAILAIQVLASGPYLLNDTTKTTSAITA
ncbi:Hint domain-containing protein [Gluconobacter sp. P5B12]|uniref:Hint domain-containing protein n=1 Tax=unclassified Gluconobacter TaxID=2644261 RepID=UPI001C03EC67|nr:Hint domain-containing protein [Gluconobacter sp. P5B12]